MASTSIAIPGAGVGLRALAVRDLGTIGYAECWALQDGLAGALGRGEQPETLLLLEHPHTYTCGRRGGRDHILIGEEELASRGATVIDVDRGGDVTYHGPGQLVAYPIIDLRGARGKIDYHAYLRKLEQTLVDLLADFDISAYRLPAYTGVWTRQHGAEVKIAAIGVKVDGRGITTHGIAINVTTDLSYFGYIVPCGILDKGVTSMQRLLGAPVEMGAVKAKFAERFASNFGFRLEAD